MAELGSFLGTELVALGGRRAGSLSEIRGEQLAFTGEETRQLLTGLGAPVTAGMAAALAQATEGWAVALWLAAACL
jgi:LuxR family maltose regulon positive regulatory protein